MTIEGRVKGRAGAIPQLDGEQVRALRRVDGKGRLLRRAVEGFPPLPLEGLRRAKGMTVGALAARARMSVLEVQALEAKVSIDNVPIETVRRYLAALGGTLELVVRFPETGHFLGVGGAARAAGDAEE